MRRLLSPYSDDWHNSGNYNLPSGFLSFHLAFFIYLNFAFLGVFSLFCYIVWGEIRSLGLEVAWELHIF